MEKYYEVSINQEKEFSNKIIRGWINLCMRRVDKGGELFIKLDESRKTYGCLVGSHVVMNLGKGEGFGIVGYIVMIYLSGELRDM